MNPSRPITETLQKLDQGSSANLAGVFESVYTELKALAGAQFRGQPARHTLQPTALVNEAYLRLVEREAVQWRGRSHFKALAARAMKQILVDHHRARRADKRGGGWKRWSVSGLEFTAKEELDALALTEVLDELKDLDPRQGKVVELRFFGGLEELEIAHVLGLSRSTVQAEWRHARAWLRSRLAHDSS